MFDPAELVAPTIKEEIVKEGKNGWAQIKKVTMTFPMNRDDSAASMENNYTYTYWLLGRRGNPLEAKLNDINPESELCKVASTPCKINTDKLGNKTFSYTIYDINTVSTLMARVKTETNSQTVTATIDKVDGEKPEIPKEVVWNSSLVEHDKIILHITARDKGESGIEKIQCKRKDREEWQDANGTVCTVSNLDKKTSYRLEVKITDFAGNSLTTPTQEYTTQEIESMPIKMTQNIGCNGTTVHIKFPKYGEAAVYEYNLDNKGWKAVPTDSTSGFITELIKVHKTPLYARVTYKGREKPLTTASMYVDVDNTPPKCTWAGPAKSPIKNGTTTTYTLTCTDNYGTFSDNKIAVADIESSSTGAAYVSAVSAPTAVTNGYKWTVTVKAGATSHGTAQFRLKAGAISDVSGNKNALTAYSTALRNDSTGPTVKFGTNGSTTYSKTKSTTVSATDSYSAVSTIKYQWSQSTTAPTSFGGTIANGGTVNGSGVTGSNWYLWVQATDALGNVTTVKSNAFYFDNTAPTISASNNSGSNWTFNKVIISGTVSDGHSGINASSIEYSYDKSSTTYKDWDTATTSAYSGTWAAARNQPVYVRVCDKAGNWSAWVSAGYVRIFSALRGPVTTWGSLVGTANSKFQSGAHVKEVSKNASQSCFQWRCQAYVDRGNFNGTKVTTNWYIDFTMNGVGYYADSGWKNFATPCHNYGTAVTNTCNASYTGSSTYTATSSASITSYITS